MVCINFPIKAIPQNYGNKYMISIRSMYFCTHENEKNITLGFFPVVSFEWENDWKHLILCFRYACIDVRFLSFSITYKEVSVS